MDINYDNQIPFPFFTRARYNNVKNSSQIQAVDLIGEAIRADKVLK